MLTLMAAISNSFPMKQESSPALDDLVVGWAASLHFWGENNDIDE